MKVWIVVNDKYEFHEGSCFALFDSKDKAIKAAYSFCETCDADEVMLPDKEDDYFFIRELDEIKWEMGNWFLFDGLPESVSQDIKALKFYSIFREVSGFTRLYSDIEGFTPQKFFESAKPQKKLRAVVYQVEVK